MSKRIIPGRAYTLDGYVVIVGRVSGRYGRVTFTRFGEPKQHKEMGIKAFKRKAVPA